MLKDKNSFLDNVPAYTTREPQVTSRPFDERVVLRLINNTRFLPLDRHACYKPKPMYGQSALKLESALSVIVWREEWYVELVYQKKASLEALTSTVLDL